MTYSKGMTLIELIIILVVVAIAIPPLMNLFGTVATRTGRAESTISATAAAEMLMEEILSKAFTEPDSETTHLGFDKPEKKGRKKTFDDVDDFDTWKKPLAGFKEYDLFARVFYVTQTDLITPTTIPTNYKRIEVNVSQKGMSDVTLVAIATPYPPISE